MTDGMTGYQYAFDNMHPFDRAALERSISPRVMREKRLAKVATLLTELQEQKRLDEQGENDD
jgi:hypothetical protein